MLDNNNVIENEWLNCKNEEGNNVLTELRKTSDK